MEDLKYMSDGTAELSAEIKERLSEIKADAARAAEELVRQAGLREGDIFVVGCSTSEVIGNVIGKASVRPVA